MDDVKAEAVKEVFKEREREAKCRFREEVRMRLNSIDIAVRKLQEAKAAFAELQYEAPEITEL